MVVRSADGHVRYMIDGDLHESRGALEVASGPASASSRTEPPMLALPRIFAIALNTYREAARARLLSASSR